MNQSTARITAPLGKTILGKTILGRRDAFPWRRAPSADIGRAARSWGRIAPTIGRHR